MGRIDRKPRSNLKCLTCRKAHKLCEPHWSSSKCKRCLTQGLSCSSLRKSNGQGVDFSEAPEFCATTTVLSKILSIMQGHVSDILNIVRPQPQHVHHNHNGEYCNSSLTLSKFFNCVACCLGNQKTALESMSKKIQASMMQIMRNECSSRLQKDVSFYPGRVKPDISSANSITITSSVKYVDSERDISSDDFDSAVAQGARLGDYRKAASNMGVLLRHPSFALDPMSELVICREHAVPASHIAYWNKDPKVAIELWLRDRECRDLLGRTFPRIVAENGDLRTLEVIGHHDLSFLGHEYLDFSWMSSLSVVICKGLVGCFDFMMTRNLDGIRASISHQPETMTNGCPIPELLDFALASRNDHIVRRVYDDAVSMGPYVRHAKIAIEMDREDIASLFLPSLSLAYMNSMDEVNMLEKIARQRAADILERLEVHLVESSEEVCNLQVKYGAIQNFIHNLPHRVRHPNVSEAITSILTLPQTHGAAEPNIMSGIDWPT